MKELEIKIVAAREVRRSLTKAEDIRGDVAFQNDVNALLARFEHLQVPWRSLSDLNPAPLASAIRADATPLPVSRRPGPTIGRFAPIVVTRPTTRARSG
jgi:hypothetical protein